MEKAFRMTLQSGSIFIYIEVYVFKCIEKGIPVMKVRIYTEIRYILIT